MKATQQAEFISQLKQRFEQHMARHPSIDWPAVQARLQLKPEKLASLQGMERSGGEPDIVGRDDLTGEFLFVDCAAESPAGRRSLCYDRPALDSRKKNKPAGCATEAAAAMGVQILSEDQYRALQKLGEFDTRTSSWIMSPPAIRNLGGALFCDRRYDTVFTYHNGAESYYAARGFRGILKV